MFKGDRWLLVPILSFSFAIMFFFGDYGFDGSYGF